MNGRDKMTGFGMIRDQRILNVAYRPTSQQKNNFSTLVRKGNNPKYVFYSSSFSRYKRILNNKN